MTSNRNLAGLFIILIGALLLLNQIGFRIHIDLWPIIFIILGLFFVSLWKSKGAWGFLLPATFFLLLGLYFFAMVLVSWRYANETSFVYTFFIAIGFFVTYFIGKKITGLLIPAWIFTFTSAIIFLSTFSQLSLWPLLLVGVGLWLLYSPRKRAEPDQR